MSGVYYSDNDPFCCAWLRELMTAGLVPEGAYEGGKMAHVSGRMNVPEQGIAAPDGHFTTSLLRSEAMPRNPTSISCNRPPKPGLAEKRCSRCRQVKPVARFGPEKRSADGYRYECRDCQAERHLAYRARNGAVMNQKQRERYRAEPERHRAYARRHRDLCRAEEMITGAKRRAKAKGLPFDLDGHVEDIRRRLAVGLCEMTGLPFRFGGRRNWATPSLDRIDPARGYVHGNVRIILHGMNTALANWGEEVLLTMVSAWQQRAKER